MPSELLVAEEKSPVAGALRRGTVAAALCASVCCWVAMAAAQETPPVDTPPVTAKDGVPDYPEVVEAREKIASGDREGSFALLETVAEKHPGLGLPRVLLAKMLLPLGQLTAGLEVLDEAVLKHPDHPEAYLYLGTVALKRDSLTAAGMLYDKGHQVASKWGEDRAQDKKRYLAIAYSGMAELARRRKQPDEAEKKFLEWIKLGVDTGAATYGLGQALFEQGKYKEAYEKLNAAYKANHADPPPQRPIPNPDFSMGMLYANRGDYKLASGWLQRAVDRAPSDGALHYDVANWYWSYGRSDDAKLQIEETLKINPGRAKALLLAGQIAHYEQDYPAAKGYFDAALQRELDKNERFEAAAGLVLANYEVQDTSTGRREALRKAADFLDKYPTKREAAAILAWLLFREGHSDKAGEMFARVVGDYRSLSPSAKFYIAQTFHAKGKPEQARPWLEEALKSPQLFAYRKDAAELLKQIEQRSQ